VVSQGTWRCLQLGKGWWVVRYQARVATMIDCRLRLVATPRWLGLEPSARRGFVECRAVSRLQSASPRIQAQRKARSH